MTQNQLNEESLQQELGQLDGWTKEGISLHRTFRFDNYQDITSFLNHLIDTISNQNHHPDFSLDNRTRSIPVTISTHSAGGITYADILFCKTLNAWTSSSS